MAVNSKDIETLWKQYSEEGVNKGISVAHFFESNGVPYHTFEKWYKKKYSREGIVDCVVKGSPDATIQVSDEDGREYSRTEKKKEIYISYVNIGLSNGIKIDHHRLTYGELVCFINKLQALCSV
jgi:hypothetical protein